MSRDPDGESAAEAVRREALRPITRPITSGEPLAERDGVRPARPLERIEAAVLAAEPGLGRLPEVTG